MTLTERKPRLTRDLLQRRTVRTLVGSQMLGGVGVSSGIAVGALLAEQVSGSTEFAGLGNTFQVLGSALIAIPVARIMAARGRRPGLLTGYGLAILGGALVLTAAVTSDFPLLLVGMLLFGGATTANNQARYAAADLASDARRGRDLSVVVWATTVGAVLGPNLTGPGEAVARALHIPDLSGPFVFSLIGFLLGVAILVIRLRPDPLKAARQFAAEDHREAGTRQPVTHGSIGRGLRVVAGHPAAALGMLTIALGHAVMVSVMVMTPLQMHHGGSELRVIGFVISVHVLGMYAFSPLTGLAVDRFGGPRLALAGSAILIIAALLAGGARPGTSVQLVVALFLLGCGWSCTLVSGSTMLTAAVPVTERPGAQGASDLVMGLMGAGGGALAGVVVDRFSYHVLGFGAAVLALLIGAATVSMRRSLVSLHG